MAEVKWIKIVTDIFDDEKMILIDSLPEHDAIIVIWFKLLCLAGKQNNGGIFMINDKIPYTEEMLATIFHRPLNTVRLALTTFENYGMVEIVENTITIPNWSKHQNLDSLEQTREATRKRVQKYREKQRLLAERNGYGNATVTLCNADRIEEDKEVDIDKSKREKENTSLSAPQDEQSCPFAKIRDLYHSICTSFPRITVIDGNRKKAVAARWRTYGCIEAFDEVFRNAEASSFLKGENPRNWHADFDWMMCASNFSKIRERKYEDRTAGAEGVYRTLAQMYQEADDDGKGNN